MEGAAPSKGDKDDQGSNQSVACSLSRIMDNTTPTFYWAWDYQYCTIRYDSDWPTLTDAHAVISRPHSTCKLAEGV